MAGQWRLHPDRALPAEPTQRAIARELYAQVAGLPLVSMHGHIDAALIADNAAFGDPAELFVIPDHYLTRMLVSQGYRLEELGVPSPETDVVVEKDHRLIWRRVCENWKLFRGTPTRYWLEHELVEVFGVTQEPSADTADDIYDHLLEVLGTPEFHIRPLFDRFNIEILSTTDAPDSDLSEHARLAKDGWGERVVPTLRPDALFYPNHSSWAGRIRSLSARSGIEISDYASFLDALRQRRFAFAAAGARASDHGHLSADTTPLDPADAQRIFDAALTGPIDAATASRFAANMLFETARMSLDDGLVMQLHPGVHRNHSDHVLFRFGENQGFDIPVAVEYTRGLQPLLQAFGHDPRFRIILFTVDENTLLPGAGAAGRRLSVGAARGAMVVPRLPRRDGALPRADHRDRGLLQHQRVRRRHEGVRLHPGQARSGPSHRRRIPGKTRGRTPTGTRRGCRDGRRPGLQPSASGLRQTHYLTI